MTNKEYVQNTEVLLQETIIVLENLVKVLRAATFQGGADLPED